MSKNTQGVVHQDDLIVRLKARDKGALSYLYDHYSAAIFGAILRIVNDEDIAHEVLQDSFIKYWDKINSYDANKGRLFTWMLNLARNLSIDKLRSKEIKNSQKTDGLENNVYTFEQENKVYQNEDGIGVKELIGKLREEERLIIEMTYFKGFSQSEIAEETGIPLGTVKTRLRMALKSLRNILGVT